MIKVKDHINKDKNQSINKSLEKIVFTEKSYLKNKKYSKIKNLKELKNYNERILVANKNFKNILNNIEIISLNQLDTGKNLPVFEIKYKFIDKEYSVHTYGHKPDKCINNKIGTLIIPGSNNNQSSKIYIKDKNNYHYGVYDSFSGVVAEKDIFILIKPNNDYLSWHNGKGYKVSNSFIIDWQINNGGSYSSSYILNAIAFSKWLKSCYSKSVLAGLSQGAGAVLYSSLIANPDVAIVASGYSLISDYAHFGGYDQIINLPRYFDLNKADIFKNKLKNTTTKFIFSWGKKDNALYKIEAMHKITFKYLSDIENYYEIIHEGGHKFPSKRINIYLKEFFAN